uniref:Cytochrome b561 and DOMON domain-containing protein At5g47530-like n=1 Tax=Rhizophora mucronata TaxID=61149 RepID=A0A2P2MZR0_RHIMU
MAKATGPSLFFSMILSLAFLTSAQTCSNYKFPDHRVFNSCIDLPVLQAHLHWNYVPSNRFVQIAYRTSQSSAGWSAWAINPTGTGMVGSQALVALQKPDGRMTAFSTPITSYKPSMQPGALSFQVSNISATYANNEMIIHALVGPLQNASAVNHVWQAGPVSNGNPNVHATSGQNIKSMGVVNFLS